jgi:hypothetical protein
MSEFQRELLSATSAMSPMEGGAKKRGSKKGSKGKKGSKSMMGGAKKGSKGKKGSKKGSKRGSKGRKQSREMPQWMQDMMAVKKEVKAKHSDVKDGPALTKLVMEHLKSKGSVKGAIDSIMNMSGSEIKSKLDKLVKEMAEKRAAKKSA